MHNGGAVSGSTVLNGQVRAGINGPTDEMLLHAIRDGSSTAMQILFTRHQVKVYRFILRIVQNAAVAEDLTSEVFITIWRHAGQFKARSSVSTWLLGIARYKCLGELRRKWRCESRLKAQMPEDEASETPESALHRGDRKRLLRKCLMQLSREHRTIIDLVYYHEKSVNEVAEIVGIPSGTVKTRMYYARRKLGELLEGAGVAGLSS